MSALLLLLAGGLWGATLFFSAYFLTFFIPNKGIRLVIGVIAIVGLFTLPLRDEVKGTEEFEALCKTGGVYQISPNAVGKKFDLKISYSDNRSLSGFARPVEESIKTFVDVDTSAVVATGKAYFAGGGWLVRTLGQNPLTGGTGPLMGRDQCFPPLDLEQMRRLQAITQKIVN